MTWTFKDSDGNFSSGSGTTLAVTLNGIAAGDVIVVHVTWESANSETVSIDDGGADTFDTSVAGKITHSGSEPTSYFFYLIGSVATGDVTYTATWSVGNGVYRNIVAYAYTPPAGSLVSLDGTAVGASGTDNAPNSGNITTTGTDGVAFGSYAEYGATLTSPLISGVAADNSQGTASKCLVWAKAYSSGFTGAATGSLGASERWVCQIIAFNAVVSGGTEYEKSASDGMYLLDTRVKALSKVAPDWMYLLDSEQDQVLGTVQYGYPAYSDLENSDWHPSTGFYLFATLDEEDTPDDSDFIYTNTPSYCSMLVTQMIDPGVDTGHVVRYRARGDGVSALRVGLWCNSTQIATWTTSAAPIAMTTYVQSLTTGEAANITDYTDLRLSFEIF